MKHIIAMLLAVVSVSASVALVANAQTVLPPVVAKGASVTQPTTETRGQGYAYFAPGLTSGEDPTIQIGGGGEAVFGNGVGVGADLSYLKLVEFRSYGGLGVASLNGSYHFLKATKSGKLVPFVTGGYSGFFRSGAYGNGFNYGGGINYWFHERVGLRVEFRDQIVVDSDTYRYAGVRVGVSFR